MNNRTSHSRTDPTTTTTRTSIVTRLFALLVLFLALGISYSYNPSPITGLASRARTSALKAKTASLSTLFRRSFGPGLNAMTKDKKGDVYFISHGGPPTVEQYESEPYLAWRKFGRILRENRPKGIIAISAHWQAEGLFGGGDVIVNSDSTNPLIYDFYNFPQRLYELRFASSGNEELRQSVLGALKAGGVGVSHEDRGLDHGVWIPLKAAFGESLDIPLVQLSLPSSNDPRASAKLGEALAPLRERGFAILTTGQIVHNLRDIFTGKPTPYTLPFLTQTSAAISSPNPREATVNLTRESTYRSAHPTDEHFLPLVVAAGAVDPAQDEVEEIYTGVVDIGGKRTDGSTGMGWGMWRWSEKH